MQSRLAVESAVNMWRSEAVCPLHLLRSALAALACSACGCRPLLPLWRSMLWTRMGAQHAVGYYVPCRMGYANGTWCAASGAFVRRSCLRSPTRMRSSRHRLLLCLRRSCSFASPVLERPYSFRPAPMARLKRGSPPWPPNQPRGFVRSLHGGRTTGGLGRGTPNARARGLPVRVLAAGATLKAVRVQV